MVTFRKARCFAKENMTRAWHAREPENAVAFLWRKVGVGAIDTANHSFHPIGPEQAISGY